MAEITYQMVLSTLQTVGLLVGIFYYIMTLQNTRKNQQLTLKAQELTLDTRRGQLILQYILESIEKIALDYTVDHITHAEWSSYEEWEEKYWNDPEYQKAFYWIQMGMSGIGTLLMEGLIDIRILTLFNADGVIYNWEKHKDIIYERRKRWNQKRYCDMWEYVYTEQMKYLEEHPELTP